MRGLLASPTRHLPVAVLLYLPTLGTGHWRGPLWRGQGGVNVARAGQW